MRITEDLRRLAAETASLVQVDLPEPVGVS
jgi:hypothetical protein